MKSSIKKIIMSSRPLSWVNTAYPFAAGYIITQRTINPTLIIGTLYFLIPYNLLMYGVNDVFDYESDIRNKRKGGVQGVVLNKKLHKSTIISAVIVNIIFLAYLFSQTTNRSAIVLVLVIFMVIAYSVPRLRFKEIPILDSFTSSCHFVGPLLFAVSLSSFNKSVILILISFALWGMASHAFGAVQDIKADKSANISSIATFLGGRTTVIFSVLLYLASSLTITLLAFSHPSALWAALIPIAYIINIWPFINITEDQSENTTKGWKRFLLLNYVSGFALTMLLIFNFAFKK